MRSWRKRDEAVLAGRKGFVRQAIRSGVPIVPVATVGGHDTVFVLSEGRFLAKSHRARQAPARRDAADRRRASRSRSRSRSCPCTCRCRRRSAPSSSSRSSVDPTPSASTTRTTSTPSTDEVEAAIQAGMDRLAEAAQLPDLRLRSGGDDDSTTHRYAPGRPRGRSPTPSSRRSTGPRTRRASGRSAAATSGRRRRRRSAARAPGRAARGPARAARRAARARLCDRVARARASS